MVARETGAPSLEHMLRHSLLQTQSKQVTGMAPNRYGIASEPHPGGADSYRAEHSGCWVSKGSPIPLLNEEHKRGNSRVPSGANWSSSGTGVPDRNRTGTTLRPRDFLTTTAFAASLGCSWSGLCLDPDISSEGPRRQVSARSPPEAGLRSALPRCDTGVSLNLTGFTPELSHPGAQFAQVPCVYLFRHGHPSTIFARAEGLRQLEHPACQRPPFLLWAQFARNPRPATSSEGHVPVLPCAQLNILDSGERDRLGLATTVAALLRQARLDHGRESRCARHLACAIPPPSGGRLSGPPVSKRPGDHDRWRAAAL